MAITLPYIEKKETKEMSLPKWVVEKPNLTLLSQAFMVYLNNKRQAIASVKGRSDVVGSNIKPWRQKGTGRARHGSRKSPIWAGGGIVFGPTPNRNFKRKLSKTEKQSALLHLLSLAILNKKVIVIDEIPQLKKTKETLIWINSITGNRPVVIFGSKEKQEIKTFSNIPDVCYQSINSYDFSKLATAKTIICEKGCLELLDTRQNSGENK